MSQTFPGSFTNLFGQSLLKAMVQSAMTNPQAAVVRSPMITMLDATLAQSVLSVDGMLSSVRVSVGAGAPQTPIMGTFGMFA
jgi:hypothetical protein